MEAGDAKGGTLRTTVERLKQTVGMQADMPLPPSGEDAQALDETAARRAFPFGWLAGLSSALVVLLVLGFMVHMQRG